MPKQGAWIAVLVVIATSAHAFVPPTDFIVKRWLAKRASASNMRIVRKLTRFNEDQPAVLPLTEEIAVDFKSGAFMGRIYDSQKREAYSYERRFQDRSQDGEAAFLFSPQSAALITWLERRAIPIKTESDVQRSTQEVSSREASRNSRESDPVESEGFLRRWESKPLWTFEEPTSSDFKASVGFEKDTFEPARLSYRVNAKPREYQFRAYQYLRDAYFPREVRILSDGKPIWSFELIEAKVNESKKFSLGTAAGWTAAGKELPSDMRAWIEEYVREYR